LSKFSVLPRSTHQPSHDPSDPLRLRIFETMSRCDSVLKNQVKKQIIDSNSNLIIYWTPHDSVTNSVTNQFFKEIISECNFSAKESEALDQIHVPDPMLYPVASIGMNVNQRNKNKNKNKNKRIKMISNLPEIETNSHIVMHPMISLDPREPLCPREMVQMIHDQQIVTKILSDSLSQYIFVISDSLTDPYVRPNDPGFRDLGQYAQSLGIKIIFLSSAQTMSTDLKNIDLFILTV
jgi:hypothetical protein